MIQDDHYNVIIKKEASPSCAHKPALILQGHLDMVCQKDQGSPVDFTKDALELQIDGDFVSAKGTTLGGDDGIAVKWCLPQRKRWAWRELQPSTHRSLRESTF